MGAWGVRSKESDFGLDLLNLISKEQLFKVDFAYFNVAEGISLLEDYNRRAFGVEKRRRRQKRDRRKPASSTPFRAALMTPCS